MATAAIVPQVCQAFYAKRPAHGAGLTSTGTELSLYGNTIAKWEGDSLYIRVSGIENPNYDRRKWNLKASVREAMENGDFRYNVTTLAKLSLIPGVYVSMMGNTRDTGVGGKLYLNGKEWDGKWAKIG